MGLETCQKNPGKRPWQKSLEKNGKKGAGIKALAKKPWQKGPDKKALAKNL